MKWSTVVAATLLVTMSFGFTPQVVAECENDVQQEGIGISITGDACGDSLAVSGTGDADADCSAWDGDGGTCIATSIAGNAHADCNGEGGDGGQCAANSLMGDANADCSAWDGDGGTCIATSTAGNANADCAGWTGTCIATSVTGNANADCSDPDAGAQCTATSIAGDANADCYGDGGTCGATSGTGNANADCYGGGGGTCGATSVTGNANADCSGDDTGAQCTATSIAGDANADCSGKGEGGTCAATSPGRFLATDCIQPSAPALCQVVINEVLYNPAGKDDPHYEMIELYNPLPVDIDLSEWQIWNNGTSAIQDEGVCQFNDILPAGGYLVTSAHLCRMKLANDGDDLTLVGPNGIIVDQVWWADGGDLGADNAAPVTGQGQSIGRCGPDTNNPSQDFTVQDPTVNGIENKC